MGMHALISGRGSLRDLNWYSVQTAPLREQRANGDGDRRATAQLSVAAGEDAAAAAAVVSPTRSRCAGYIAVLGGLDAQ